MGVRQERRVATTRQILDVAERQIARDGATSLSLRAVAREVDLAVSALYRYFPSRDDLLTALITEAYSDCADAVEAAIAQVPSGRRRSRRAWTAAAGAYRSWALTNPSRFLLIFGTPVPGYVAPEDATLAAGTRIPRLLCQLLVEHAVPTLRIPPETRRRLANTAMALETTLSPDTLAAGMTAWDAVHGHVVHELSGQLGPLSGDDGLFDLVVREQAARLGL